MNTAFRPLLLLALLAGAASAQDFELDLSGDEMPKVPEELRPSIAVIAVKAADGDEVSASRARQFEAELVKQLRQGESYTTVVDPGSARLTLGAEYAAAEKCSDYACWEAAAKKLKVHRLVRLTVQKQGAGSLVTLYGWDPGFNEVLVVAQDSGEKAEKTFLGVAGKSQAQKDKEFLRKMSGFMSKLEKVMSQGNGKIVIDSAEPTAVVTVEGSEGCVGSCELIVQRGSKTVKVSAAGYQPFSQNVTVEAGKEVAVKVQLVAIPIEVAPVKVVEAPKLNLFSKPGLYVALAGAVATGVGIALGQSAQSVKTRLAAGGDPVAVTRADAKAAPVNAILANVLVGVGGAAVAGGVTWVIVTLPPPPPPAPVKTGTEPTETTAPAPGAFLGFGGNF